MRLPNWQKDTERVTLALTGRTAILESLGLRTALSLTAFVLLFLFRRDHIDGDAVIYADNILNSRFGDISIHFGYYCLSWLTSTVLGISGMKIDQSMILLSVLSGAGCAWLLDSIACRFRFTKPERVLLFALLLSNGYFLENAVQAEVYLPQTLFVLLSWDLCLRGWGFLAGISFAVALAITPITVFVSPLLFSSTWFSPDRRKMVLRFLGGVIIFWVPIVSWHLQDFFWGRRGLLSISSKMPINGLESIFKTLVVTYGKSASLAVILFLAGIRGTLKQFKPLFWGLILSMAAYVFPALKQNQFDLGTTTLPLLVASHLAAAAFGSRFFRFDYRSAPTARAVGGMIIGCYILFNWLIWIGPSRLAAPSLSSENQYATGWSNCKSELRSAVLITEFWDGVSYSFYTRERLDERPEATEGNPRWVDIRFLSKKRIDSLIYSGTKLYVLDSYSPSWGATLLFSKAQLEIRDQNASVKGQLRSKLGGVQFVTVFHCGRLPIEAIAENSISSPVAK